MPSPESIGDELMPRHFPHRQQEPGDRDVPRLQLLRTMRSRRAAYSSTRAQASGSVLYALPESQFVAHPPWNVIVYGAIRRTARDLATSGQIAFLYIELVYCSRNSDSIGGLFGPEFEAEANRQVGARVSVCIGPMNEAKARLKPYPEFYSGHLLKFGGRSYDSGSIYTPGRRQTKVSD
jgi:hypothetical protein